MKTHVSHGHLNLSSLGTVLPPLLFLQNHPVRRPVLGTDALILRGSQSFSEEQLLTTGPSGPACGPGGRGVHRHACEQDGRGQPSRSGAPVGSLLSSRRPSSRARRGRTGGRHAGQAAAPAEHPPRAVHTGPAPALGGAGRSVPLRSSFAPPSLQ